MSAMAPTPTAAVPRPLAAVRAWAASDRVAQGALAGVFVVLAALTWGAWGDLTMDTGYDLLAASRTAQGELPYVDYGYFYGPLAPLLLGGIYAVTGAAVWPAVALGLVLSVAATALTYRLARRFAGPPAAAAAGALVACAALSSANNSFVLPHSTSAPLAIVLALAAILWLTGDPLAALPRDRLIKAGVACGLVALTRPELALALFGAVAVWLAVEIWQARGARRPAWRAAALVAVPALALPVVVYGAFLTAVSPRELLLDNLYPTDFIRAAGHVVLDAHAPLTAASVAKLAARVLLYAAGVAGLVALGLGLAAGGRRRTLALAAIGLGVLGFAGALAVRPETVRYYLQFGYNWIPAGAWLAAAVLIWRSRDPRARSAASRTALLVALLLGAATVNTYASFNPYPNALFPEATPYVLPVAAAFLVWLHVTVLGGRNREVAAVGTVWIAVLALGSAGLMVKDARQETVTVHGPHGSLAARAAEAPALQRAVDAIVRNTRPGEPVLVAPQMTALYVMTDRPNPLPQLSLLPGELATAQDEEAAIARMRDVRLVVTDRTPLDAYEHGAFGTTYDSRIAAWLRSDFRLLTNVRGAGAGARTLDIWLRRTP
jgi:4-amino-4-deoxy-L-arabinose transferase-like glycosyltransferase